MYLEICVLRDVARVGEWCDRHRLQSLRGSETKILVDKNCIFMRSANFKILSQIKVNSIMVVVVFFF
jgi:hypothetical protein